MKSRFSNTPRKSSNTGASSDAPVFFPSRLEPRWGLCCQFLDSPIRFRKATHRYCASLRSEERQVYLSEIVLSNANALIQAIERCVSLGIGAFRVTSQILPLATHPESGYTVDELVHAAEIGTAFERARVLSVENDIRLSFHPDQFVVLNSESAAVVKSSIREVEHQAVVANLIGAEALTLHGGGFTGGATAALERLERGIEALSDNARRLLCLENDDRLFSPEDLLLFCERMGIPFVYDVHHHRCRPDNLSVREATDRCTGTWRGREPWMHISSPRDGWKAANPRLHADFIDPADVPQEWRDRRMTIDVEAKEKERAVIAIRNAIRAEYAE